MKIAHLCLSNWYVDNFDYQENCLIRQHVLSGHDVLVVASTETISRKQRVEYVAPSSYVGSEGARVTRLPYAKWLPHGLMKKLRIHTDVLDTLKSFAPDVILFHGTCGWELHTVARYAQENDQVKLFVDSHEDKYNSARNFLSRTILHRQYYARVLRAALPNIEKILCYSTESMDFVKTTYGVPGSKLELFPLGGFPIEDSDYINRRQTTRNLYGIDENNVLFVQAGKQTSRKRLVESLKAFSECASDNYRFIVAGSIAPEISVIATKLISCDKRVQYVGWQSPDEIRSLLCAADIYLQPGTQSVTMQNSMCCRCALILDDVPSHRYYVSDNGWLIREDRSLNAIIQQITTISLEQINSLGMMSFEFAKNKLDYRLLAARILSS